MKSKPIYLFICLIQGCLVAPEQYIFPKHNFCLVPEQNSEKEVINNNQYKSHSTFTDSIQQIWPPLTLQRMKGEPHIFRFRKFGLHFLFFKKGQHLPLDFYWKENLNFDFILVPTLSSASSSDIPTQKKIPLVKSLEGNYCLTWSQNGLLLFPQREIKLLQPLQ